MLVRTESNSHWYTPQGQPCYEVPRKSREGTRPATLSDARKLGLVPSVTNILSVVAKPSLESWKIEQAILSALTLPRLPDEGLDAYAQRVVQDCTQQSANAAQKGSEVHDAIARFITDGLIPVTDIGPIVEAYADWHKANVKQVLRLEDCFAGLGFGGRVDAVMELHDGLAVVDFKTQSTKPGRKATAYDEYGMQLAAYDKGMAIDGRLINIILSTTEPGRIDVHEWTDKDRCWQGFQSAFALWRFLKNYQGDESWNAEKSTV